MVAIRGELEGRYGASVFMRRDVIGRRFRVILCSEFVGFFDQLFTVLKSVRCMLRDGQAHAMAISRAQAARPQPNGVQMRRRLHRRGLEAMTASPITTEEV